MTINNKKIGTIIMLLKSMIIFLLLATGGYSMEQRIGNKNIGYISLSEEFIKFEEATGSTGDIQYSDGANIFTLNIFQDKNHTLETASESVFSNFVNRGIANVEGATIEFGNKYKCYQIYGAYNNFMNIIVAYVFKINGNIHLIVFEGPKEYLQRNLKIAETYRFEE